MCAMRPGAGSRDGSREASCQLMPSLPTSYLFNVIRHGYILYLLFELFTFEETLKNIIIIIVPLNPFRTYILISNYFVTCHMYRCDGNTFCLKFNFIVLIRY